MINWWLVKFVQILDWSSDYFAHWKLRLKTSTQCHTVVVTLTASWLHRYKSVNNTHISDELEISPLFPHAADRYFFVADTGAWDNFAETWGLGKRDSFVAKMGDTQNMFLVGSSGLVSDHPFDVGVSYFQIYPNNRKCMQIMKSFLMIANSARIVEM